MWSSAGGQVLILRTDNCFLYNDFLFQMKEVAVLMGLMCKYSCENCDFVVFDESRYEFITPKAGTILDNMADTVSAVCIQ